MKLNTLPDGQWVVPGQPRISAVPYNQQTLTQRFFLRLTRKAAGASENLNVFMPLARLGSIFPRYLMFLSHLLKKGRIPLHDKEQIILRIAWRVGCIYEWGHHEHMAREQGVSTQVIESIAQSHSDDWSDRLRIFIKAADELLETCRLSEGTWAELSTQLSSDQMVEFCMLVGHYVMVAGLINSTHVNLEPGFIEGIG